MRTSRLGMLVLIGMIAAMVGGCAGMGKGPTDAELIQGTLTKWKADTEAKNLDGMMAAYSEQFQSERGGGKAEMKDFVSKAIDQGYLDGAKMDISKAEVKITGDTATVAPIELSGSAGQMTLQGTMKKEPDKVWRIVSLGEF